MRRYLKNALALLVVYLASFGLCIGFTGGRFVDRRETVLFKVYYPLIRGYTILIFGWDEQAVVLPQTKAP